MEKTKFFQWLRSQLRRISMKWKPRSDALNNAKKPYTGENKRRKWQYQCSECNGWYAGKEVQVDHIIPCGQLTDYEDLPGFVERLFCDADGLQVVCKSCHQDKTNEQRGK